MISDNQFYRGDLPKSLLQAMFQPFTGWSDGAMQAAALRAGIDPALVTYIFPHGSSDAIAYYSNMLDQELIIKAPGELAYETRLSRKVAACVKIRLILLNDNRDAVRQAVAIMALPHNLLQSFDLIMNSVNAIWQVAGDGANDFSYYTKRMTLAIIWAMTLLFWLQDKSHDYNATWLFLDARLRDVVSIAKDKEQLKEMLAGFMIYNQGGGNER